jgi:DNA-binding NarL/FixJ family response regulator
MRATIEATETCGSFGDAIKAQRLRVVLADGSPQYMSAVLVLLEFHEMIDLIGRAANFEEAIQLVANHQPDMVLIDLEMPLANLAIPAMILCTRTSVKIAGLCATETIPLLALDFITGVNALIHRSRLRQEFLSVVGALYDCSATLNQIPAQPELDQPTEQPWTKMRFHKTA